MQPLLRTLSGYDLELLRVIANRWDVDLSGHDARQAAAHLAAAMLDTEKITGVWSRLPDDQRGALQALHGAGGKMAAPIFARMYGAIRPFGPDKLVREKPYLNPENVAEALYYRGLIATTFAGAPTAAKSAKGQEAAKGGKGAESARSVQPFIYIPSDLAALMPVHLTGYALHPEPAEAVEALPEPEHFRQADTTLIDDLTTFLTCCQVENMPVQDGDIPTEFREGIGRLMIGPDSPARFGLMMALALDMGLVAVNEAGYLKPVAQTARAWLDSSRPTQVRALAEAWRRSVTFNELRYTPGIQLEPGGTHHDPLLARQTVITFLELVPHNAWWPIQELVEAVKEEEPDFQRPAGDYDSWYIRDAETNAYLRGFESWDKIDGAVLRSILTGPMHSLGLLDLSADGSACRLNAYGRAMVPEGGEWPKGGAIPEGTPITIHADGLCEVPRSANRYERFQLARFTAWERHGDPYLYRITPEGIEVGRQQGLRPEQIATFLRRVSHNQVPEELLQQIEIWGKAASAEPVSVAHMVVLRTPNSELMATIMNAPALRRYLGTPLGPTAVAVRADQRQALIDALRQAGIPVQVPPETG
jgi:hypothetical protein